MCLEFGEETWGKIRIFPLYKGAPGKFPLKQVDRQVPPFDKGRLGGIFLLAMGCGRRNVVNETKTNSPIIPQGETVFRCCPHYA